MNGKSNSGMSILETMIGVAIIAVGAMALMSFFGQSLKSAGSIHIKAEKEVLKRMIVNSLSCNATYLQAPCNSPNQVMRLLRFHRDGTASTLAAATGKGSKYGSWTIRGECGPNSSGIVVKAARLTSTGTLTSTSDSDFVPDPVTGERIKWNNPKSKLFGEGIELCAKSTLTIGTDTLPMTNNDTPTNETAKTVTTPQGSVWQLCALSSMRMISNSNAFQSASCGVRPKDSAGRWEIYTSGNSGYLRRECRVTCVSINDTN